MAERLTARKIGGLLGVLNLHHITRLFLSLFADRRVSLWLKVSAVSGLIYVFSPLDVLPDFLTGIGLLDDLIVSLLIMQAFVELAPAEVVDEHCRRLRLDPERIFVSVPRTVLQALELFDIVRGRSAEPPQAAPAGREEAQPGPQTPLRPYSATIPGHGGESQPSARYSAERPR
jgi:uncharacterized membrane protein YkvA (DUF1232 family)